jgi:hypothetical protein
MRFTIELGPPTRGSDDEAMMMVVKREFHHRDVARRCM